MLGAYRNAGSAGRSWFGSHERYATFLDQQSAIQSVSAIETAITTEIKVSNPVENVKSRPGMSKPDVLFTYDKIRHSRA